jgi:hypothetical protein
VSRERSERVDLFVTVLLSIAALATSWAGYQASVWNGDQLSFGARATELRTTSTRAYTRAGQKRIVDVQLFSSWLGAYAQGNTRVATFFEHRFRPEFAPAFRAWIATKPLDSPDAAPSPFALSEYRLADEDEAQRLSVGADQASADSQHANMVSDDYVFDAVILATVMFFATAAQRLGPTRTRSFLFVVAVAMCATGIYRLATSSIAWPS